MKHLQLITAALFLSFCGYSQITATNGLTPTQYVNNVLLGSGVTASNVTYRGSLNGIGQFIAPSATNLGFSTGIYLTTGSILQVDPGSETNIGEDGPAGPSSGDQQVKQIGMAANDHDLHRLLANSGYDTINWQTSNGNVVAGPSLTNDVSALEFDFIPTSDTISFRYRFGSEEYNEWVQNDISNGFNDIFAFLLKGVSPAAQAQYPSYKNIALIPNTNIPVSIFTVNNGISPLGTPGPGGVNSNYYVDNYNNTVDVVYDGITVVLTAKASVICGEKYHIKLTVADVGDQIFDSGVFIEGGSFSAAGNYEITSEVNLNPNDNNLVEGCNSGSVTITRTDVTSPQNIQVVYSGIASPSTDFTGLPTSVSFAAGQNSATISLQALNDGITEGSETFSVGFIVPSACGNNNVTLYADFIISDISNPNVDAGDDVVDCNGSSINQNITAVVTGGGGNLTYTWNTGAITPTINVNAVGEYIVTVTDGCNQTASDTVLVYVATPSPLSVSLAPDLYICPNTPVSLLATVTGGNGTIHYSWSNGATGNPIQLSPGTTTTITVRANDACGQTASDEIIINVTDVTAQFTYQWATPGTANFVNQSQPNGLTYHWDFGDGQYTTEKNPQHIYMMTGSYVVTLTATNEVGCVDVASQKLDYRVPSEVFIPNTFTPNNDGVNDDWLISISYLEDFELYIFDRWGQLVFKTDDLYDRWQGTYHNEGKPLKCDRYVYRILYTEYQGNQKELLGSVTLLK
jgi:gliding motility-associated-like protein